MARVSKQNRPLKVLVVEDDPTQRKLFYNMLHQIYRNVHVARLANGVGIEKAVMGFNPALLLLDLNLPGVNGFQICSAIDENPELRPTLRILAVSGLRSGRVKAAILAAGADAFLPKPFQIQDLERALKKILPA